MTRIARVCFIVAALALSGFATTSASAHDGCADVVEGPAAAFSFSPASPSAGQEVTFDASSSSGGSVEHYRGTHCGDAGVFPERITAFQWEFGDGTAPVTTASPTTTHVFQSGGTYTVKLTVSAGAAGTDSISRTATVTGAANPSADFDWTMPSRTRDDNNDGLIDGDGVPLGGYKPSGWTLNLDAGASLGGPSRITEYKWEIEGLAPRITTNRELSVEVPQEKSYAIKLTITNASGQTDVKTRNVPVQDRLVVVMGDSYASGEGNPHTFIQYGIGTVVAWPTWDDQRCHRSFHAASARAAVQLEKEDPRTSVTYLSRACSGATISGGIVGPYAGIDPRDPENKLDPQIHQVREQVGTRKIDDLLISIGGNDIGFAGIITACLLNSACHTSPSVVGDFDTALQGLPNHYARMRSEIQNQATGLNVASTYITEYPDFTTDIDGSRCTAIGSDLLFGGVTGAVINADEATWASDYVLGELIKKLRAEVTTANDLGLEWHYVGGVASAFTKVGEYGHGYCVGDEDRRTPDRWLRTFTDSCDLQGKPVGWISLGSTPFHYCQPTSTDGQFHPNEHGHAAIAQRYLVEMRANPPNFDPAPGTGGDGNTGGGNTGGGTTGGGTTGTTGGTSGDSGLPPLTDSSSSVGAGLPPTAQIPAGTTRAPGKCARLKGRKRTTCIKRSCGKLKRKKARYRACVKRVTRRR